MNTLQYVLFGLCFFVFVACGKGFKVNSEPHAHSHRHEQEPVFKETQPDLEDSGQFYRVKSKTKGTTQKPKSFTFNNKEIKVYREKLNFSKLSYEYKDGKMVFRGELKYGTENKNFELSGKYNQGLLDLTVEDKQSELYEKLKARATCYSLQANQDESQCENFFIDIYYLDKGSIYTEQVIPRKEHVKESPVDKKQESSKHREDMEGDVAAPVEPIFFQGQADKDIIDLFSEELSKKPVEPETENPPTPVKKPGQQETKPENKPVPKVPPQKPEPKPSPKPVEKKPTTPQKIGRPTNQAVGGVGGLYGLGSLKNATSLMESYNKLGRTGGFQLLYNNDKHYGTWDLVKLIEKMGAWVNSNIPGQILSIGNISTQFGGVQESHVSHQNGLDVDIAYFTPVTTRMMNVVNANGKVTSDLMIDAQFKLFKQLVNTEAVEMILVHHTIKKALCERAVQTGEIKNVIDLTLATKTLKQIYTANDHNNHFHLRLKCSSFDRSCSPTHHLSDEQPLGCTIPLAAAPKPVK